MTDLNETRKELGRFSNIVSGYARGTPQSLAAYGARTDINTALWRMANVETLEARRERCMAWVEELESDLLDARDKLAHAEEDLRTAESELEDMTRSLAVRLDRGR